MSFSVKDGAARAGSTGVMNGAAACAEAPKPASATRPAAARCLTRSRPRSAGCALGAAHDGMVFDGILLPLVVQVETGSGRQVDRGEALRPVARLQGLARRQDGPVRGEAEGLPARQPNGLGDQAVPLAIRRDSAPPADVIAHGLPRGIADGRAEHAHRGDLAYRALGVSHVLKKSLCLLAVQRRQLHAEPGTLVLPGRRDAGRDCRFSGLPARKGHQIHQQDATQHAQLSHCARSPTGALAPQRDSIQIVPRAPAKMQASPSAEPSDSTDSPLSPWPTVQPRPSTAPAPVIKAPSRRRARSRGSRGSCTRNSRRTRAEIAAPRKVPRTSTTPKVKVCAWACMAKCARSLKGPAKLKDCTPMPSGGWLMNAASFAARVPSGPAVSQ